MAWAAPSGASGGAEGGHQQELQLETRHLLLLIALVVALCVASFMFGRWVERQSLGPPVASLAGEARDGDAEIEDMGDVSKDLTFFDTLERNQQVPLQAQRPAARLTPRPAQPAASSSPRAPSPAPVTSSASGSSSRRSLNEGVMIQVFASKDRSAADAVRKRLRSNGYTALLVTEKGFYKVRVGPYADREEAERSAAVLREREHLETRIP